VGLGSISRPIWAGLSNRTTVKVGQRLDSCPYNIKKCGLGAIAKAISTLKGGIDYLFPSRLLADVKNKLVPQCQSTGYPHFLLVRYLRAEQHTRLGLGDGSTGAPVQRGEEGFRLVDLSLSDE
jgi:hypothetical protein